MTWQFQHFNFAALAMTDDDAEDSDLSYELWGESHDVHAELSALWPNQEARGGRNGHGLPW